MSTLDELKGIMFPSGEARSLAEKKVLKQRALALEEAALAPTEATPSIARPTGGLTVARAWPVAFPAATAPCPSRTAPCPTRARD